VTHLRGRVMALDVGERRVGVAMSDLSQTLATPYTTLHAHPQAVLFQKIQQLIVKEEVVDLVIGLPISLNGQEGPQAQRIRQFIAAIATCVSVPLHTCDERYTTAEAQRVMIEAGLRPEQRKAKIDEVAASIILQDYLNQQQHNE
jgi:putative Holliday junction resolvase